MKAGRLGRIGVPAAVVMIVVMLVIPMPSFLLDLLITCNMTLAVMVLLVSMKVTRALDFSIFPSLLLVATMFRLALNVSATRLVLLHGFAGNVIESFGHFVVGGSLVVGLVVFLILIVIQFVVITNGAGRVAEVAARFTLDAMPGKQMAIDADLNAGFINEAQARQRRRDISAEADFYGAMDGASKFVKGDAMAAVVITLVNLIGGFIVGVVQNHMSVSAAINQYSLLSVGDGLVSQIPALLLSISTGLIVTRAASEDEFGHDLLDQFTRQRSVLTMAGAVIGVLGLVPGLPKLPFLLAGGATFLAGWRRRSSLPVALPEEQADKKPAADTPETLAQEARVEPLELELAFDIIDLVDPARAGDLLDRVRALRRKVALDTGLLMPAVRTRDNLSLPPAAYAVRLHGVEVARGSAPQGRILAIGDSLHGLPGEPTTEPVFGLAAKWLPSELRQQALMVGATVVDRSSVVTTHLGEVVRIHAGELLSRQMVKQLLDVAKSTDPVVVDDLAAAGLNAGDVQRVLRGLLTEEVPIRDLVRILEAMSEQASVSKDPERLVEAARGVLGGQIVAPYVVDGVLPVLTLDALLEQALLETLRQGEEGTVLMVDAQQAERIVTETARLGEEAEKQGRRPVLICSSRLRPALRKLVRAAAPRLPVIAVTELGPQVRPDRIGVITVARAELATAQAV